MNILNVVLITLGIVVILFLLFIYSIHYYYKKNLNSNTDKFYDRLAVCLKVLTADRFWFLSCSNDYKKNIVALSRKDSKFFNNSCIKLLKKIK